MADEAVQKQKTIENLEKLLSDAQEKVSNHQKIVDELNETKGAEQELEKSQEIITRLEDKIAEYEASLSSSHVNLENARSLLLAEQKALKAAQELNEKLAAEKQKSELTSNAKANEMADRLKTLKGEKQKLSDEHAILVKNAERSKTHEVSQYQNSI
jgi:flagellar biosynthesis chaperone FliJ